MSQGSLPARADVMPKTRSPIGRRPASRRAAAAPRQQRTRARRSCPGARAHQGAGRKNPVFLAQLSGLPAVGAHGPDCLFSDSQPARPLNWPPRRSRVGTGRGNRGGAAPPAMRQHGAGGVSPEACAVIRRHGLDRGRVPGRADRCGVEEGVDFNLAPRADLENAPPGRRLARMVDTLPAFGPFRERLGRSLRLFDYGTSGGIMDEFLRNCIVERAGKASMPNGGGAPRCQGG